MKLIQSVASFCVAVAIATVCSLALIVMSTMMMQSMIGTWTVSDSTAIVSAAIVAVVGVKIFSEIYG